MEENKLVKVDLAMGGLGGEVGRESTEAETGLLVLQELGSEEAGGGDEGCAGNGAEGLRDDAASNGGAKERAEGGGKGGHFLRSERGWGFGVEEFRGAELMTPAHMGLALSSSENLHGIALGWECLRRSAIMSARRAHAPASAAAAVFPRLVPSSQARDRSLTLA